MDLLQGGESLADLGRLVEGTQTAAAYLDLDRSTVAIQGLLVYVGLEARLGVAV